MENIKRLSFIIVILLFSNSLYGAASDEVQTEPSDFETSKIEDEIYDPIEPFNRAIFSFNNTADKIILEPISKGYKKLPSPLQAGISNFLSNLRMPLIVVNQLLQGQGKTQVNQQDGFFLTLHLVFLV